MVKLKTLLKKKGLLPAIGGVLIGVGLVMTKMNAGILTLGDKVFISGMVITTIGGLRLLLWKIKKR